MTSCVNSIRPTHALIHLENRFTWKFKFPNGDEWLARRFNVNKNNIQLTIRERRCNCKKFDGSRYSTKDGVFLTKDEWIRIIEIAKIYKKSDDIYNEERKKG